MNTTNRIPVAKVLMVLKKELHLKNVESSTIESAAQIRVSDPKFPTVQIVLAAANFPVWPMGRIKLNSVDMLPYFKADPSSEGGAKLGILEKFWDCLRKVDGEFNNIEVQSDTILFSGVFRKISDRDLDCYRFHCRVNLGVKLDDVVGTSRGLHDAIV